MHTEYSPHSSLEDPPPKKTKIMVVKEVPNTKIKHMLGPVSEDRWKYSKKKTLF